MITDILLSDVATFRNSVSVKPKKVNYIYGANGSGKTTISKVISNISNHKSCSIDFISNEIDVVAYNRDFVANEFHQLKGIFTLGKDVPEAEQEIESHKSIISNAEKQVLEYNRTLEKQNGSLSKQESDFYEECWIAKTNYAKSFQKALTGSIGTKILFANKCIAEQSNTSELKDFVYLSEQYNALYNVEQVVIPEFSGIFFDKLLALECATIFKESIVGKSESKIGELIDFIGNSDWVNKGLSHLDKSKNKECPFCQRPIDDDLRKEIEDFFDESYKKKCEELESSKKAYIDYVDSKILDIKLIADKKIDIFSFDDLKNILAAIEAEFEVNKIKLDNKTTNKSQPVELISLNEFFCKAECEIDKCIEIIKKHNDIAVNIKTEKYLLSNQIWRFIANDRKIAIEANSQKTKGLKAGILNIEEKIRNAQNDISNSRKKIRELEASITSITHSVNEINRLLQGFHFKGFHLAEAQEKKGHYKIIRDDGKDAKETLSEGEFTFITFLYFYHLLKGNTDSSGIVKDRIVVIDDPISSLDSNVLFIVSNLVKSLVRECLDKNSKSNIKQIFIMTHNIYFHKEVTFRGSRENICDDEIFWVVRKLDGTSNVHVSNKNPVNTTYKMLWDEIKDTERLNKATVFNTIRRILEYYFNIIGGFNYEKAINEFNDEEKHIFKTLISWINDGSHCEIDDIFIDAELESIERYLEVFRDIFDKLGHISHYNMMMGIK